MLTKTFGFEVRHKLFQVGRAELADRKVLHSDPPSEATLLLGHPGAGRR
jgi:hypothetical protein